MRDQVVAVLGAGIMGSRMARRLVDAGFTVRVWDRTHSRARQVHGAAARDTAEEAVDGADVVITMVADGPAVDEIMINPGGALHAMKDKAVWLQMSTVGIAATDEHAAHAEAAGVRFVDAPVLGTRDPAEQGQLVVLAAGDGEAIEECRFVFAAIARKTIPLGAAGKASRLKLVFNGWLLMLVASLAESLALARGLGIDPHQFLSVIAGGSLDLPYAQVKGPAMLDRTYPTSFPLRLALKDALLVQEAATEAGLEPALIDAAATRFAQALELGFGDADMAAVFEAAGSEKDV